jgi:Integrase zinc binding domain
VCSKCKTKLSSIGTNLNFVGAKEFFFQSQPRAIFIRAVTARGSEQITDGSAKGRSRIRVRALEKKNSPSAPLPISTFRKRVLDGYKTDEMAQKLEKLGKDPSAYSSTELKFLQSFSRQNGLWWNAAKLLYIPENVGNEVLERNHDLPISGHQGNTMTIDLISRKYWWPSMVKTLELISLNCLLLEMV